MFAAPAIIKPEVFARIPDSLWKSGRRMSILEGPSFDREGNLLVVNVSYGQVFKIAPSGDVTLLAEYDGEPNGLKIHKDGRIFIADHRLGLVQLDPHSGKTSVVVGSALHEPFKGLNDLVFNSVGDLYFTDQGESDLHHPDGRVWVLRASGHVQLVIDRLPSPNGIVVTPDDRFLYVAVTRANAIWRVPLRRDGTLGRVGNWIQLSGGAGPDGMALDESGGIAVAHAGMGSVWLFDHRGRPVAEIPAPKGLMTTNVAFGGPQRHTLYITEADTRSILRAELPVAGLTMYSGN